MTPSHTAPPFGAIHPRVTFGSAQLAAEQVPEADALALLEAAVCAGVARLDTAPLYGHGASEGLVAQVAARHRHIAVTTKVGLEPAEAPPRWRLAASSLVRRLPAPLVAAARRVRTGSFAARQAQRSGRFEIDVVRRSIERSLKRLGAIDRLLLHEVHPADVDERLLETLLTYRNRGDVAVLGVATGNALTADALARSHGVFTVAHICIDPLGPSWPDVASWPGVQWVGHGALGAAGRTLLRLKALLRDAPSLSRRWSGGVAGTAFDGEAGIASALYAHVAQYFPGEMLVATRQSGRVRATVEAASGTRPAPPFVAGLIIEALHVLAARSVPRPARGAIR